MSNDPPIKTSKVVLEPVAASAGGVLLAIVVDVVTLGFEVCVVEVVGANELVVGPAVVDVLVEVGETLVLVVDFAVDEVVEDCGGTVVLGASVVLVVVGSKITVEVVDVEVLVCGGAVLGGIVGRDVDVLVVGLHGTSAVVVVLGMLQSLMKIACPLGQFLPG